MEPSEEKLWYFAYGSNINSTVLTGRRNVKPSKSLPAFAPNYYLNFSVVYIPYAEPSFASLGSQPILSSQPIVHGVAHEITKQELTQIQRTEGGGGHDGIGYVVNEIEIETYDGKQLTATTLVHISGETRLLFPSTRYLTLLENGAEEFNLKSDYQNWLKSLPRYSNVSTVRHWMGKILFLSFVILMGAPVMIVVFGSRAMGRRAPRIVYIANSWMVKFWINAYWYFYRPIFGSGAGEHIKYISK